MKYYCWYDNGTGYYEGPYVEEHNTWNDTYKANDVGYGAYVSETDENPNRMSDKEVMGKNDSNTSKS